jgi:hypothetical protein
MLKSAFRIPIFFCVKNIYPTCSKAQASGLRIGYAKRKERRNKIRIVPIDHLVLT